MNVYNEKTIITHTVSSDGQQYDLYLIGYFTSEHYYFNTVFQYFKHVLPITATLTNLTSHAKIRQQHEIVCSQAHQQRCQLYKLVRVCKLLW